MLVLDDPNAPHPLHVLLNQINHAADIGLNLLAISGAVALPDICAALGHADGRSHPSRYKEWCKENLPLEYFSLYTPDDLYSLRCGILHQGSMANLKHGIKRAVFFPKNCGRVVNLKMGDAAAYSVPDFCGLLGNTAAEWLSKNVNNEVVVENSKMMMHFYPNGLLPYTSGLPIIA